MKSPSTPDQDAILPHVVLRRLAREDEGAVFLEFLIVLFAFMFILFGVIQVGLISMASFYTNYANFYAMRTAAVTYELKEDGVMSATAFDLACIESAANALAPMERYYYKNRYDLGAIADLYMRLDFNVEEGEKFSGGSFPQSDRAKYLECHLTYEYPLIVPFANYVFAAFDSGVQELDENRVMQNFRLDIPQDRPYPLLTINSSDDISEDTSGSPPYDHRVVVQRRWVY